MLTTDWRALHGDAFKDWPVLITGGAGFIGSHLAVALATLGARVTVLDDLSGGSRENISAAPSVQFIQDSITDPRAVADAMAGAQYVLHQAALGSVPRSVAEPRLFHEVNVTGTLNVLEAARAAGVRRMVFAASSSAYGDSETLPKIESMPAAPLSPYAANKVACEAMLAAWSGSYGIDTVSLRYFNIFGPRQNANSAYAAVIASFARALLDGQRPVIFGDGEQSRDFTYVDNVVQANLLALRTTTPLRGAVMNIACGQRITVNQLATRMAALVDRADLMPRYEPARAGDVKHSLADLARVKDRIGYRPISSFEDGLAATMIGVGPLTPARRDPPHAPSPTV